MIAVEPFVPAHLAQIEVQAAQRDVPVAPDARVERGWALSATGRCFTVRDKATGAILMCGGAVQVHAQYASVWMVLAEGAPARRRTMGALLERCRWYLERLHYRRIDCVVRADHEAGARWAWRLGFRREGEMRAYLPDGADAVLLALKGEMR